MKSVITALLFTIVAVFTISAQEPITIYLAGDSTMAEKLPTKRPETGWGEFLQAAFDEKQVRVENHARNGRSTRTFLSEGRWVDITNKLKPGDYVFIQFGHNDSAKEKADRYTPPEDYRNNLVRMVVDVRSKQAYPVLLTPVMRRKFDQAGNTVDTHGEYPTLVREVATLSSVPLIDMHRASQRVLAEYGDEPSRKLFLQLKPGENPNYSDGVEDNTHFNATGARVMCDLAVAGIRASDLPIAKYLQPEAKNLARPQ